jgi:hypothetical protein
MCSWDRMCCNLIATVVGTKCVVYPFHISTVVYGYWFKYFVFLFQICITL